MDEINYRNLDRLDALEIATVQRISSREFEKIKRNFTDASLVVDIKKINKQGKRASYEVKARIDIPSVKLYAEHTDWELQRALHRTFDNLKVEVEHKFKKREVKWPGRIRKD